ncbi:hypothetical protein C8R46DRAFT_1186602, partial [Mycena filopes]
MARKRSASEIEGREGQDRPTRLKIAADPLVEPDPRPEEAAGVQAASGNENVLNAYVPGDEESDPEREFDREDDPPDGMDDDDSDEDDTEAAPTWTCGCGQPALQLVAGDNAKPWNRGRPFAKCAMGNCQYWTWCDDTRRSTRQQLFNESMDAQFGSGSYGNGDGREGQARTTRRKIVAENLVEPDPTEERSKPEEAAVQAANGDENAYVSDEEESDPEREFDGEDEPSDGMGEDDPSDSADELREAAREVLVREHAARLVRDYSPTRSEVDSKLEEMFQDHGEEYYGDGE